VTSVLQKGLIFLASFAGMELVAYLTHRFLMHGALWFLHESHHVERRGPFEWNDLFGVFFSVPSIVLIYLGVRGHPPLLWVGLGMTAYGAAYFGFHDVIVHRRLSIRIRPTGRYMRRIIQAHRIHHATETRDGAISFGFLYAPPLERMKKQMKRA
jgi:beta-carotene 3-hydroxylase